MAGLKHDLEGSFNSNVKVPRGGCGHDGDFDSYLLAGREGWEPSVSIVRWLPFGLVDVRVTDGYKAGAIMTVAPSDLWCDCQTG